MLKNFTFTVTIPKFKNITWSKWNVVHQNKEYYKRQFGKLSFENQELYFSSLIEVAEQIINYNPNPLRLEPTWVVEKFPTDPSRYHMHGTFYEISLDTMIEIQQDWARIIGFRFQKQINDCIFIKEHHANWDEYIQKDQEEENIIDQNMDEVFCTCYGFQGKN